MRACRWPKYFGSHHSIAHAFCTIVTIMHSTCTLNTKLSERGRQQQHVIHHHALLSLSSLFTATRRRLTLKHMVSVVRHVIPVCIHAHLLLERLQTCLHLLNEFFLLAASVSPTLSLNSCLISAMTLSFLILGQRSIVRSRSRYSTRALGRVVVAIVANITVVHSPQSTCRNSIGILVCETRNSYMYKGGGDAVGDPVRSDPRSDRLSVSPVARRSESLRLSLAQPLSDVT